MPPQELVRKLGLLHPKASCRQVFQAMWGVLLLGMVCAGGLRAEGVAGDAAMLQGLVDGAARGGVKKVVIPAGTYHLAAAEGAGYALKFVGVKDLEIDATGVKLICTDRVSSAMLFDRCEGVTLRGALIRHEPVPFSQGRIEAIGADRSYLDIRVAQGYPQDLDDPAFFPNDGNGFLNVFDPGTRQWKRTVSDVYFSGVERREPGVFRFRMRSPLPAKQEIATGDLAAWRGRGRADITLNGCARMSLIDLRIENGIGFCVHENGGEGGNFYKYTVTRGTVPAGATEAPLFACNADAFHSSKVRHGPTLEDCVFEYMDDDGVPIHGGYAYVAGVRPEAMVLGALGSGFCRAGDALKFYDEKGSFAGQGVVRSFAKVAGPGKGYGGEVVAFQRAKSVAFGEVGLEKPLEVREGWLVANASAVGSDFAIRRCTIRQSRARGMLIKASRGVIEDCVVEGTTMAGIALWPDMGYWNESDFSSEVVIRRNTLRDVSTWNEPWNPMAGALSIGAAEKSGYLATAGGHRNILVEGNRFEADNGINILVSSAQDVRIKGNVFIDAMRGAAERGKKDGADGGALIWITRSSDIQVEDNVVTGPGSFLKKFSGVLR